MTNLPYGINAWLFLNEDEPTNTNYNSPSSCFQSLIQYRTYNSVNFLGLAFFEIAPVASSAAAEYTIKIGDAPHPGGLSNQDYLNYILRDARRVNPNIKFLATMQYSGESTLAGIFSGAGSPEAQAAAFANNLLVYLKNSGMNGLDVDWEGDVSTLMTQQQFKILFSTIRQVFDQQPVKFWLSFTPASPTESIDYDTVNSAFDFISPQLYDGVPLSAYPESGINPAKIGYGAQFEPDNSKPNTSAQQVWQAVERGFKYQSKTYGYQDIFVWRLNSGNFQFEQAQFMILSQLAYPPAGNSFDDAAIIGAAGQPTITQMTIRSGDVLNAIQADSTGTGKYNAGTNGKVFMLPQHGGDSGGSHTIEIPLDNPIVSITGYTGVWYGWQCVLQLTLTAQDGSTYGPYGSMNGSTSRTPFAQNAPSGQSVVAFRGSTVTVPLADGSQTAIIANLSAIFG
ncbi:jacalin-like lectin [Chromobacterium sp. IIBBL 290-4]|uniref:jacalin-like lectin n=1 Tax=Chromobacterium sp. IIBBL 290-4 TaxID=2953890 RepID=UPI0020B8DD2D|nr:glycosyl hydrolase family 18 protein [Chromobacterium sp. IIBBL 290-4]UTH73724.1 glycosyl hydrolase family 18 protein [Chromobacterium sp. IIBBL 290-4]